MNDSFIEIQDKLRTLQTKKRFIHSLGVQYTTANLAMRYDFDLNRAQLTGLLHDCGKYMSDTKMLSSCNEFLIPITAVEERNPFLLHAKLSAYLAKNVYCIDDEEIINAITYHTTGRTNMTLLEKLVFVADYIEPSRKYMVKLDAIRKIAYKDLDMALLLILENTLDYLNKDTKREIDPMTEQAYKYYEQLCHKQ